MSLHTGAYNVAGTLLAVSFHGTYDTLRPYLHRYAPFLSRTGIGPGKISLSPVATGPIPVPALTGAVCSFPYGSARFHIFRNGDTYESLLTGAEGRAISLLQSAADFSENRLTLSGSPAECFLGFDNAMMMAFAFAGATRRTLLLHASAVVHGGKAYLFLGKSGTGKSTHARLWQENIPDTTLLNDDNPALLATAQGPVTACRTPWSGKTACYRNEAYPVGAIVRLSQGADNTIRRERRIAAFASLLSSCSTAAWDAAAYQACRTAVADVAASVPLFSLTCRPDAEAARLCAQAVGAHP